MTSRWQLTLATAISAGALLTTQVARADAQPTPAAVGPESGAAQPTPTPPPPTTTTTQPAATPTTGTTGTTGSSIDARAEDRRTTEVSDEQADVEDTTEVAEESDTNPREERDRAYMFAGAFYRHMMVPEFLIDLFAEAGATYFNPAFGAEFTYRRNGFDITAAIWWANFEGQGAVRGQGDPDTDTEIFDSTLSSIFASASFMWSTEFNEYIAFSYGVDVGIGIVLGDLTRREAYPDDGGPHENGGTYSGCQGAGVPNGTYCDVIDSDDPRMTATVLIEDGVPPVVPWLALPHLALRIKPIRQLMFRVDLGFSVLGFFTGVAANYGF